MMQQWCCRQSTFVKVAFFMLHFNEVVIVTCPFQKNLIRGPESLTLHQYYINISMVLLLLITITNWQLLIMSMYMV